jgi:hypothetical protein
VEHQVHQRQAVRVVHQLHAVEGLARRWKSSAAPQLEEVVGRCVLDVAVGRDQEAAGAGGRVLHVSPGCGFMSAPCCRSAGAA